MNKIHQRKLGLIGCGGFGQFCLAAYSELEQLQIAVVADVDQELAKQTARRFKAEAAEDPDSLIQLKEVEIVHIATPPNLHYSFALQAARHGKHVICEKPLALSLTQADEMLECARQNQVIMPVNFILRYLPLVELVKKIIDSGLLGKPLRATFENYATDKNLPPQHWFWDKSKSGGIFVEHGVHFFDLYEYWFGNARVLDAHAETRPGTGLEDRVICLLRHQSGVLSSHYHGFDQPACLDRAAHRILFETGDVTITGWIPQACSIHAILDDANAGQLHKIFPAAKLRVPETFDDADQFMQARGKPIKARKRVELQYTAPAVKSTLYARAVQDLIADQIAYIDNPAHQRIIREENGRNALALAQQVTQQLSRRSNT